MEEVHSIFKLPDLVAPLFLLCLGYPDDNPGLKPRLPKEVVHKIDYYDDTKDKELIDEYNETMKKYYNERTHGKSSETWAEKSSKAFSRSKRDQIDDFLKTIGFLNK